MRSLAGPEACTPPGTSASSSHLPHTSPGRSYGAGDWYEVGFREALRAFNDQLEGNVAARRVAVRANVIMRGLRKMH